jgi:hypothetical protein
VLRRQLEQLSAVKIRKVALNKHDRLNVLLHHRSIDTRKLLRLVHLNGLHVHPQRYGCGFRLAEFLLVTRTGM